VTISGNLSITGNTFSTSATQIVANDTLIILGTGNYFGDILDVGFAAHYNNGVNAHTGLMRDSSTKEWQLFEEYTPEIGANNSIVITDSSFKIATLNANVKSTTITIKNIDVLPYINAAFAAANTATSGSTDTWVRTHANTAYDQANSASSFANGAFVTANSAASFANGAFVTANSGASFANGAFDRANAAYAQANTGSTDTWVRTQANNAYDQANSASSFANGAFVAANSTTTTATSAASFANGAFVTANSAASFANGAFDRANNGYGQANTGASFANGAFVVANSAASFANGAFVTANSAASFANGSFLRANGAYEQANNGASFANGSFVVANSAASFANGAFVTANSGASFANGAFNQSNTYVWPQANSAASFANGSFVAANSSASFANGAFDRANAAYAQANTSATDTWVRPQANAAFDHANAAYAQANTGAPDSWARAQANAAFNVANTANSAIANSGILTGYVDAFTANGVSNNYTLSTTPSNKNITFVAVQGVLQPKASYNISGTVLTFDSTPPNTAYIEVSTLVGAGGGAGGGSSITWSIISANTTMTASQGYFVNTAVGPLTMTLPTTATLGDTIQFNDLAGTFSANNLTIARNGHNIQRVSTDLIVNVNDSSFGLVYSNSTYGWKVLEL
jgi:hypothetical protein